MGAVVAYFESGGGRSKGVGIFFLDGDIDSVVVRGGDVGTNPQDVLGPEYFPTQGRVTAHLEASRGMGGWELGVTIIGGSNGGSRL